MTKSSNKSIGAQTSRIVKVSANVGSLVAKIATKNFLGISSKETNAIQLMNLLGNLKGPIMKVAQILATIPGALPKEYSEHLAKLQSEAPSMGRLFVKRRMRQELGSDWIHNFNEFNLEATKAASLGQVHKAVVKNDSGFIACKLQYPNMETAIKADLKQLKVLMKLYKQIDNAIDTQDIYKELEDRLIEEIDYVNEFKNILIYKNIFVKDSCIKIPVPRKSLSTSRLLTMNWLDGEPLVGFYESSIEIKNNIATNLFKAWYLPFYRYGVIHGDPHPGNYTINNNGKTLNLLDFGCIRIFKPEFVGAVIQLYNALKKEDKLMAANAYSKWGFKNLNNKVIDALNIWALYLYGPLLEDKVRKIQNHNDASFGKDLLNKVRLELRKHGGIKPPKEFVLLDRAAIGLGSVFMNLNAEINWHNLFNNLIHDFDVKDLRLRQKELLSI